VKVVVVVMPKQEVLDPQGQAIGRASESLGYADVVDVRQGKRFVVTLGGEMDRTRALAYVSELAEKLLANTVIEDFSVESIEP
jgi:phosphoribosylformylglycinamidine synthase